MLNLIEASNKVKHMNHYLQTQEKRKFSARARQENENPLPLKEILLCIAVGLFGVYGVIAAIAGIMELVKRGVID